MQFVINDKLNPSFNLAFEEEILYSDYLLQNPLFCLWRNQKSVIVGISQVVEDEVNLQHCNDNGILVVKRHTGGGAVYHDLGNLNFSFFLPNGLTTNPYHYAYSILKPSFKELGIEINVSKTNDLLFEGKKFSGMAQRIIGERVMVHGTILYDTDFEAMAKALSTTKSKFTKPRGVASRRAEVTNLKGNLKKIKDIIELENALIEFISNSDKQIVLTDEFYEKVNTRAREYYKPLNLY